MFSGISEQIATVIVQDYGPIGIFALVLWHRQGQIISAVTRLAEEHEDVDEERIQDEMKVIGGD